MRAVALALSDAVGIREILLIGLPRDIFADSLHVELRLSHLEGLRHFDRVILGLNVELGILVVLEKLDDFHLLLGLFVRLECAVWLVHDWFGVHISEPLLVVILLEVAYSAVVESVLLAG